MKQNIKLLIYRDTQFPPAKCVEEHRRTCVEEHPEKSNI